MCVYVCVCMCVLCVVYQAVPVVLQVSVGPEWSVSGQLAADGDNLTFLHAKHTHTHTHTDIK